MTDYLLLFVGTVLVNNFVLVKFLGLCPFMGVSKKLETAIGMGLATTFVITLASICAWLVNHLILLPLDLVYLRTMAYILVIAVVAALYVREKRSGRRIGEGDRQQHEAVRQAQADAAVRGPNGGGQTWL